MTAAASSVQIEQMLDFLTENRELALGILHSHEGRLRTKRLWEVLAAKLNSLGGAVKTVPQWKKVWADKKYLAKKASAAARRSTGGTGGGPPTAELLSANDLRVISIMGEGFGGPDMPAGRVPAIFEPVTAEAAAAAAEPAEVDTEERILFTPPPEFAHTPTRPLPASRRTRRRLRPAAAQPDLASRVLALENEKKGVLEGIHRELKELNILLNKIYEKM